MVQVRKVFPTAEDLLAVEVRRNAIDELISAIRDGGGLRFFRLEVSCGC